MINFREEEDGALCFDVRVVPRASKSGVAGEHGGALRVRVAAPPVEGAANDELVRTLAKPSASRRAPSRSWAGFPRRTSASASTA